MLCKVSRDKYPDNKPRAECNNFKRHYDTSAKFKKCDPTQMMLDYSDGKSTHVLKFEAHMFYEFLSYAIIIHDLPF